jgi:hypothetical protein
MGRRRLQVPKGTALEGERVCQNAWSSHWVRACERVFRLAAVMVRGCVTGESNARGDRSALESWWSYEGSPEPAWSLSNLNHAAASERALRSQRQTCHPSKPQLAPNPPPNASRPSETVASRKAMSGVRKLP